ncbi:NRDE family protein [Stenotrophomonas maltophilia]|nr:NRDE family protein [Stenotrophomonas maltophilia]
MAEDPAADGCAFRLAGGRRGQIPFPRGRDLTPLWNALADEHRPVDSDLPDTGIGLERERWLSPAFIRGDDYGTRASTVLLIDADGHGEIHERRFGPQGVALGQSQVDF